MNWLSLDFKIGFVPDQSRYITKFTYIIKKIYMVKQSLFWIY